MLIRRFNMQHFLSFPMMKCCKWELTIMSGNMFVPCQLIMERLGPLTLHRKKNQGGHLQWNSALVSWPQKQVFTTIKKAVLKGRFCIFFRKSLKKKNKLLSTRVLQQKVQNLWNNFQSFANVHLFSSVKWESFASLYDHTWMRVFFTQNIPFCQLIHYGWNYWFPNETAAYSCLWAVLPL